MESIKRLQEAINARQSELHAVAEILTRAAERNARRSAVGKVLVVVLGAAAATNGAAVQVAGQAAWVILLYTLIGLAIATVGGLDAAFKVNERAVELTVLAATCQSTTRDIDSRWHREVGSSYGDERGEAAQQLIEVQDAKLTEVQDRAARLGVNIALEVREIWGETDGPYLA
jgi:hypothetical protein